MSEKVAFIPHWMPIVKGRKENIYVWQKNEIIEILGDEAEFSVPIMMSVKEETGREKIYSGSNDPRTDCHPAEKETGMEEEIDGTDVSKRIRPQLDDKILSGWNALMITACCKAFAALGEETYRKLAIRSYAFPGRKNEGRGDIIIFIIPIQGKLEWEMEIREKRLFRHF